MATTHELTGPARTDYSIYEIPAPPAAADVTTELEEFRRFLGGEMARGIGNVSVDAVLAEFRLYQSGIRRMREGLRPILERRARGEDTSVPWDKEKFLTELDHRLEAKGLSLDGTNQG